MRAAVKSQSARPRKAVPANRGYGQPGKAKHDPAKHPRDANGRFITTGGSAKSKTPRTRKAATPKPPKPPKKVGTVKQRKGLADQIRAAKATAATPEARAALVKEVRDLRAKRAEWKRGQGKTQVERLPKPPKEPKPKKEAKPKTPKKEKVQKQAKETKAKVEKWPKKKAETKQLTEHEQLLKRVQARRDRLTRAGAKTDEEKGRLVGERIQQANEIKAQRAAEKRIEAEGKAGKAAEGDLRAHAESLLKLRPSEQKGKLLEFIERHKGPTAEVGLHGMNHAESMHSIRFGEHTLHFPGTEAGRQAAAGTARDLVLSGQLHPEVARHTKNIYLTSQANYADAGWAQRYNIPGFQSAATGAHGDIVAYHGARLSAGTFAHEAGHNLADARYRSTHPDSMSDFMKAAAREAHPSEYATKSPAEDFAESVRMYTEEHAKFKASNPLRHKVIKRMLEDPTYGG